jgi:cytochrome c5
MGPVPSSFDGKPNPGGFVSKYYLFLCSLFAVLASAACSNQKPVGQAYQPDYARGMSLYEGQCGSCHDAGRKSAPSIRDAEEWDLRTLTGPGAVQQHLAMNWLPERVRQKGLSENDEADVLYYIKQEIGKADTGY